MEFTSETVGLSVSIFAGGFLCTQFLSHVLTLDSVMTFLATIWMTFFTKDCLALMFPNQAIDALHEYLLMQVAAVMLIPALVWFLSTDPMDVTIRTAIALARLVAFGSVSLVTYLEQHNNDIFAPTGYVYIMLSIVTLTVVYTVHLYYNSRVNAYSRGGNLTIHLRTELAMCLITAGLSLSVPAFLASLFGQEPDNVHVYLYRLYGAMTCGLSCLPWVAPRFRTFANRRAVLFSKALCMLAMLLVTFYQYNQGDLPEGPGSRTMMTCLILLTIPAAVGSMRYEQGSGWDLPWRGLRVPEVMMGGGSPDELYQAGKMKSRKRLKPRRRRSSSRSRHRSRRRTR